MSFKNGHVVCDGEASCTRPVEYKDKKGYAYCQRCAVRFQAQGRGIRRWKPPAKDATTKVATFASERFKRTALVIGAKQDDGSVDVLRKDGTRIAQINIFYGEGDGRKDGEFLIVDVIDVDKRFPVRRALVFANHKQQSIEVGDGNLVSADFRVPLPEPKG